MAGLFTALRPTQTVREALANIGPALACEGTYLAASDLHITLIYFGDMEPKRVAPLLEVPFRSLRLSVKGLDILPHRGKDALVVRVELSEELAAVQEDHARYAESLGVSVRRPYVPHITLVRDVVLTENEKAKIAGYQDMALGALSFETCYLMQSARTFQDSLGRYEILDARGGEGPWNR